MTTSPTNPVWIAFKQFKHGETIPFITMIRKLEMFDPNSPAKYGYFGRHLPAAESIELQEPLEDWFHAIPKSTIVHLCVHPTSNLLELSFDEPMVVIWHKAESESDRFLAFLLPGQERRTSREHDLGHSVLKTFSTESAAQIWVRKPDEPAASKSPS